MKKVGFITLHHNCNYGAALQTYALQKKIEDLGHEAEIINYVNSHDENEMRLFGSSFIRNIRAALTIKKKMKRIKAFKKFFNDNYNLSGDKINSLIDLSEEKFNYDTYITGSDQTFNLLLFNDSQLIKPYFLPFVKKGKKISYSSSMGEKITQLTETEEKWMKYTLSTYEKISVREHKTSEYIHEKLGIDKPEVVADPTLLLDSTQWDELHKPTKYTKDKYILFYSVLSDSWVIESVKMIAKKLNMKVIAPHLKNRFELTAPFVRASDCGPCEFIGLVKNASVVLTSSFHGTVFSILYNKPFISYVLGEGNRITGLLNELNLAERIVKKDSSGYVDSILNIDYTEANTLLEQYRQKSIEFLQKNI